MSFGKKNDEAPERRRAGNHRARLRHGPPRAAAEASEPAARGAGARARREAVVRSSALRRLRVQLTGSVRGEPRGRRRARGASRPAGGGSKAGARAASRLCRAGRSVRTEAQRGARSRARADEARGAQREALRDGKRDPAARGAPGRRAAGAECRADKAFGASGRGRNSSVRSRNSSVCCRRARGGAPGTRRRADGGRATRGPKLLGARPAQLRALGAGGEGQEERARPRSARGDLEAARARSEEPREGSHRPRITTRGGRAAPGQGKREDRRRGRRPQATRGRGA